MRLPDQSPPVWRSPESRRARRTADTHDLTPQGSRDGQCRGVDPSGYEDCYKLRGLAQQLCLNYY
jgi:hypothetical protein